MGGWGSPTFTTSPKAMAGARWEMQGHGAPGAHLNWQKMSAYSAEMLEACRTVTRKVKMLPSFRWSRAVSSGPSGTGFSGLSRRRSSGVTAGRGGSSARRRGHPPWCLPAAPHQGSGLSMLGWAQEAGCRGRGGCSPTACQHPLTCAGVVVDFVGGGTHVADLPLAFDDAQLLLGGPRARHPHGWA